MRRAGSIVPAQPVSAKRAFSEGIMDRGSDAYRFAIIAYARELIRKGDLSRTDRDAILRELATNEEEVNISRLEAAIAPKGLVP